MDQVQEALYPDTLGTALGNRLTAYGDLEFFAFLEEGQANSIGWLRLLVQNAYDRPTKYSAEIKWPTNGPLLGSTYVHAGIKGLEHTLGPGEAGVISLPVSIMPRAKSGTYATRLFLSSKGVGRGMRIHHAERARRNWVPEVTLGGVAVGTAKFALKFMLHLGMGEVLIPVPNPFGKTFFKLQLMIKADTSPVPLPSSDSLDLPLPTYEYLWHPPSWRPRLPDWKTTGRAEGGYAGWRQADEVGKFVKELII